MTETERIARLEQQVLDLQASCLLQSHRASVLLALLEYCADNLGLRKTHKGVIREQYEKLLRQEVHKKLAEIADKNHTVASILGKSLESIIGEPPLYSADDLSTQ